MPINLEDFTPYPEINQVLAMLLNGVQSVLSERLVGLYIHGSLAAGDFTPGRSDIDFVASTSGWLPESVLPALVEMHARITHSGLAWAEVLEGSYVPVHELRRYQPENAQYPALRTDGSFAIDGHGPDWIIQCHVLREHGLCLCGPDIKTLIEPVSPDDLRQATAATLRQWWAPVLDDQTRLQTDEYRAYTVMTMCRGLYTLTHGSVASKSAAARWAQNSETHRWAGMIERALTWRHGMAMDGVDAVLELVRYTLLFSDPHFNRSG